MKQVLAFTAMTYENEIASVNGRNGYLITDAGKPVASLKDKPFDFPATMSLAGAGYLLIANSADLITKGFDLTSLLMIVASLTLATFSVILFRRQRKTVAKNNQEWRNFALGHEPQGLWEFSYPESAGPKAKLIQSILGARMMFRKMIHSTSIPMSNEAIDAQVVSLIKEISNSPEDEIHEVLTEQAHTFCKLAVTQMSFYAPLITFHDEMEKEFQENSKES